MSSTQVFSLTAENGEPERIDKILARELPEISRSRIDAADSLLTVNGVKAKKSTKASAGDRIELTIVEHSPDIEPETLDLEILFENEYVVVLNKQQGMVVHPAAGNWHGTLVHGLLGHLGRGAAGVHVRPGIVHRLDKDTSGTIITAKDEMTREFLSSQFAGRTVRKRYIAILKGTLGRRRGTITSQIVRDPRNRKRFTAVTDTTKGKSAVTKYLVLKQYQGYALVSFELITGRTHQIRVHARHLGHPILGDPVYAGTESRFPGSSLMLHALSLEIDIPQGAVRAPQRRKFISPMPERFKTVLRQLHGADNR
jgi:23S rRNA pseudouridine1911/1915/1917 synthase